MSDSTTIRLDAKTRKMLYALKKVPAESYDSVIQRLIKEALKL